MSNKRTKLRIISAEITEAAKHLARLLREKADLAGETQNFVSVDTFAHAGKGAVIIQASALPPGDGRLQITEEA